MVGHQVSAAFRAVLPLAERRLLEGGHLLRPCGNPHRLGLPEAESVHRSAGPGPAGLAMTIAHCLWFAGHLQLDSTAEAASHVSHSLLPWVPSSAGVSASASLKDGTVGQPNTRPDHKSRGMDAMAEAYTTPLCVR